MYHGLKKRKTYDEIINYLLYDQEIIKYPDRSAKKRKEWTDQKFHDYNLYKEMRLQKELKNIQIKRLFSNKSTQTYINHKATQDNIVVDENQPFKKLDFYTDEEVIDRRYLLNRKIKDKETQTRRYQPNNIIYEYYDQIEDPQQPQANIFEIFANNIISPLINQLPPLLGNSPSQEYNEPDNQEYMGPVDQEYIAKQETIVQNQLEALGGLGGQVSHIIQLLQSAMASL